MYDAEKGGYGNGVEPGTLRKNAAEEELCYECGAEKEDFWEAD